MRADRQTDRQIAILHPPAGGEIIHDQDASYNVCWLRLGLHNSNKTGLIQVRSSSGTAVYPHMPILRPHAAQT